MKSTQYDVYPVAVSISRRRRQMLFLLAVILCALAPFASSATAQTSPAFSQAAIDDAMGQPMVAFGSDSSGSHGDTPVVVHSSTAFFYLSMVAHFNPNATSSSGASVASHVLAFFRFYIAGGHEPSCSNPLYGWGDGPFGQGLLYIRTTPALWNSLTAAEQAKADILMKSLAIAGNWGFNDANNFSTGLGGQGNFHKTNNPNYVQSYLSVELACSIYFGSADNCNSQAFASFSFTPFVNELTTDGFTNITSAWNVTGASAMNAAVTIPFVFNGVPLSNQNEIFYQMALPQSNSMYTGAVSNTGCNGAAHIDSGSSPVLGQSGQAHEFESSDSAGCRSDALYSYEGWMGSVEGRAALMNFGLWGGGPHTPQVEAEMSVGSQDLIFKLHQGYTGVSLAGTRDISDAPNGLPVGKGYLYLHDIYNAVIAAGVQPKPDFSISATPATQSVTAGNSTSYTVTLSAIAGFTGSVSLSVGGLPSGASGSFSPASVSGSGTATLTVSTSSSTPAGSSPLTVTGTSGSLTHSASVTLTVTVPPPDFTLSGSPGSQSAVAGNSATYSAGVSPLNGFTGSVALTVSGLPSGATGSFSPASISGGSGTSTLTVSTSTSTPAGTFNITIKGSSGSLSHAVSVTLVVTPAPDFSLSVSPATQSVTVGGSATYTASVSALNGFTGSVTFSVTGLPGGATASFSPASVSGSGSSTLTVATTSSTATGSSTLSITGTSGALTHSATATLTVNPVAVPDFSISATPASQTVTSGNSTTYTVKVGALNGFSGTVSLAASGLPAGATASFNPASISTSGSSTLTIGTGNSTPAGTSTVTITGSSGSTTHSATVTLVVTAGGACVTATQGGPWQNTAFAAQTGSFTAQFDGTPSATGINSVIALSNGAQTAYTGFAVLVRFNPSGDIDARNGGAYAAASTIPYSAGVTYHFRVVVDVPSHTYSVFVTPPGGSEITVGSNFAFRTEQNTVSTLNNIGVFAAVGSDTECNFTLSVSPPPACLTATQGGPWQNESIAAQTGTFTAQFDGTPSATNINSVIALSDGAQTAYTGFAVLVRFNPSGDIDARNGGAYAAASTIPYSAGTTYHFRVVVNVASHTYSVFVTPPGGSEITVGSNFAFRTEQNTVSVLNNLGIFAEVGSDTECNFTLSP